MAETLRLAERLTDMDGQPHTATSRVSPVASAAPGFPAGLLLFFLAPAIAELLSGSSPPAEYFTPFSLIVQHLSYGALAVLLREVAVRYGLGWWGRLPLALTMGVYIEGVLCKTFYSLHWGDFSFPEGYGRLWGVNWPWALSLTVYHALMSCLLPWLAVELVYPALRNQSALTRRSQAWLWAGVLAAGLLGNLCFPQTPGPASHDVYHPGLLASLFSWGGLLYLPWLAARYGPRLDAFAASAVGLPPLYSPRMLAWLCAAGWTAFFGISAICTTKTEAKLPAGVNTLLILLVAALALTVAQSMRGAMTARHCHACLLGTAWFWCVFGLLQELDNSQRPDNTLGMAAVGLADLLAAYALSRLLRRRVQYRDGGIHADKSAGGQDVDNPRSPLEAPA